MKEKIYTIPVNDAFDKESECPVCSMKYVLEQEAVAYVMGPSYMEDDMRAMTDEMGFCEKHLQAVYNMENRLGFALVMKTHLDKVISEIEKRSVEPAKGKLFQKKIERPEVNTYIEELNQKCYVCNKVSATMERYLDTILYLYKTEEVFREKYHASKGFCTSHYADLIARGNEKLSGTVKTNFLEETQRLYLDNMKRVRDDVAWFINKFDYKYAKEPWYNAKDSLVRAMTKDNSILEEES